MPGVKRVFCFPRCSIANDAHTAVGWGRTTVKVDFGAGVTAARGVGDATTCATTFVAGTGVGAALMKGKRPELSTKNAATASSATPRPSSNNRGHKERLPPAACGRL